jgi:hypothetical protein
MENILLNFYKEVLNYNDMPEFLKKYLNVPCLLRLKNIGYFCGMNYASKNIYDFKENITRYDHSITTALLTWHLTKNKYETLAALFHDISTPCFSHVIDYMNKDYELQESTEEYTKKILTSDETLLQYLKEDYLDINNICNFKKYSVVDNNRPKLCADRLDGIILTSIAWTNNINKKQITNIINSVRIFKNEDNEEEIGFTDKKIASEVLNMSKKINYYCHTKEDNYMMDLLAKITKIAIKKNIITYEQLYFLGENTLLNILMKSNDLEIIELLDIFQNIRKEEITDISLPNIKERKLNPLVLSKRLIK